MINTTMKIVCFTATICVLLFACDASDDPKCKEGESYEKECNTCTCTSSGVFLCTLRACYDGPQFPDTVTNTTAEPVEDHTEIQEANGQVCTPNETKMQDCNRCKCSANGIVWICTRRLCLPTSSPKIPVNEPGFTCPPNQTFMDDCNTCSCDESGTLARCTAMACDPNERQKRSDVIALITTSEVPRSKHGDCVPGARWKQECNSCWCTETGLAACTLKGCLGSHQQKFHHAKFHPAQVNRVIDTTVSPDITTVQEIKVVESNKVKRQTKDVKKPSEKSSANTPQVSNQNDDKVTFEQAPTIAPVSNSTPRSVTTTSQRPHDYKSTSGRVVTEAELDDPNFKCLPSQSFKVACNTCWCAADGKSARFCSRQACAPKTYPTLAPQ